MKLLSFLSLAVGAISVEVKSGGLVTQLQFNELWSDMPPCFKNGCGDTPLTGMTSQCETTSVCFKHFEYFRVRYQDNYCSDAPDDVACWNDRWRWTTERWGIFNGTSFCNSSPSFGLLIASGGCCASPEQRLQFSSWAGRFCNNSAWTDVFYFYAGNAKQDYKDKLLPLNCTLLPSDRNATTTLVEGCPSEDETLKDTAAGNGIDLGTLFVEILFAWAFVISGSREAKKKVGRWKKAFIGGIGAGALYLLSAFLTPVLWKAFGGYGHLTLGDIWWIFLIMCIRPGMSGYLCYLGLISKYIERPMQVIGKIIESIVRKLKVFYCCVGRRKPTSDQDPEGGRVETGEEISATNLAKARQLLANWALIIAVSEWISNAVSVVFAIYTANEGRKRNFYRFGSLLPFFRGGPAARMYAGALVHCIMCPITLVSLTASAVVHLYTSEIQRWLAERSYVKRLFKELDDYHDRKGKRQEEHVVPERWHVAEEFKMGRKQGDLAKIVKGSATEVPAPNEGNGKPVRYPRFSAIKRTLVIRTLGGILPSKPPITIAEIDEKGKRLETESSPSQDAVTPPGGAQGGFRPNGAVNPGNEPPAAETLSTPTLPNMTAAPPLSAGGIQTGAAQYGAAQIGAVQAIGYSDGSPSSTPRSAPSPPLSRAVDSYPETRGESSSNRATSDRYQEYGGYYAPLDTRKSEDCWGSSRPVSGMDVRDDDYPNFMFGWQQDYGRHSPRPQSAYEITESYSEQRGYDQHRDYRDDDERQPQSAYDQAESYSQQPGFGPQHNLRDEDERPSSKPYSLTEAYSQLEDNGQQMGYNQDYGYDRQRADRTSPTQRPENAYALTKSDHLLSDSGQRGGGLRRYPTRIMKWVCAVSNCRCRLCDPKSTVSCNLVHTLVEVIRETAAEDELVPPEREPEVLPSTEPAAEPVAHPSAQTGRPTTNTPKRQSKRLTKKQRNPPRPSLLSRIIAIWPLSWAIKALYLSLWRALEAERLELEKKGVAFHGPDLGQYEALKRAAKDAEEKNKLPTWSAVAMWFNFVCVTINYIAQWCFWSGFVQTASERWVCPFSSSPRNYCFLLGAYWWQLCRKRIWAYL
jgi:hypothetical protein